MVRVALRTERFLRSQLLLTLRNFCTQIKDIYGMVDYKLAPTPPPFETVLAQVSSRARVQHDVLIRSLEKVAERQRVRVEDGK